MATNRSTALWIREIVLLNAVVFLAFGAAFLLFPAALAGHVDIELSSPSALADLRAMYGGLSLAVGALFALGLRRADWLAPSVFLVALSSAGLALGRVYSIAVAGVPSALVLALLATEVVSFVWALLAYRALESAREGARTPAAIRADA
jgi:Domain of unknown function (DUF4345)